MGLCSTDQLSPGSFDGNYVTGTKTLVYSTALQFVDQNQEWSEIVLSTPYAYNGTDNLIIEVQWENASQSNSYYNHEWFAGDNRCIYTQSSPAILQYGFLPQMILSGTFSLDNSTFAEIKVELGQ